MIAKRSYVDAETNMAEASFDDGCVLGRIRTCILVIWHAFNVLSVGFSNCLRMISTHRYP